MGQRVHSVLVLLVSFLPHLLCDHCPAPPLTERAIKKVKKGKSFGEIEDGGPIKEIMVGVAQSQRAAKRKAVGVCDVGAEIAHNVEEDLEVEEEDGIKLEAFNLKVRHYK